MISFTKVEINELFGGVNAELVADNEGTYFVSEEPFHDRRVTPALDEDERNLVHVHIPAGQALSLALEAGQRDLGEVAFEKFPPKHPGVYAVAEGVSISFLSDFVNDMPTGISGCVGPATLRELTPPPQN